MTEEYTYRGNKVANDRTSAITTSKGTVQKGGSIELSKEEADQLTKRFDFVKTSSSSSDEVVDTPKENDTGKDISESAKPEEFGSTPSYKRGGSSSDSSNSPINTITS